jgi:hypothetical protein
LIIYKLWYISNLAKAKNLKAKQDLEQKMWRKSAEMRDKGKTDTNKVKLI